MMTDDTEKVLASSSTILPTYDQEEEEQDAYSEMLRADQALKKLKHQV
jgi:hypothetical protein